MTSFTEKDEKNDREQWGSLLLLTGVCVLSHGLLIPRLGFNWDDWFWLLVGRLQGSEGFHRSTSIDRPIMGFWFAGTYALIGLKPIGWHLLTWVGRWLSTLLFWWGLRALWPARRQETTLAALLFAVYPGFQMHPLPLSASTQYFALDLSLFSLAAMLWARRTKRWGSVLDGLALAAIPFYTLMHEYYAGQELLRPLLLWHLSRQKPQKDRSRLKWTFLHLLPYLFVFAAVVVYRLFIFKPNRNLGSMYWATDVHVLRARYSQLLREAPLFTVVQLGFNELRGMLEAAVIGWKPLLEVMRLNFDTRSSWLALGLVAFSALLVVTFFRLVSPHRDDDSVEEDRWTEEALVGGCVAVFCGLVVPVLVRKNPPVAEGMFSHFMLPPLIGTALLPVALAKRLVRPSSLTLFFSFFIGLAVAANFLNGWTYKRERDLQRSLWWQLHWRAPQIKPGTLLFMDIPPNPLNQGFRSNYEIAAPANFFYHRGGSQPSLWGLDLRRPQNLQILKQGKSYSEKQRSLFFQGDARNALVLHLEKKWIMGLSEPCLKVLRPDESIPENFEFPLTAEFSAPYSNLDCIVWSAEGSAPPEDVLGKEPPHRWCYFYQKMELARQRGEWKEVVRLADEAFSKGFRPEEPTEGLIAVEGYFRAGKRDKGEELLASFKQK